MSSALQYLNDIPLAGLVTVLAGLVITVLPVLLAVFVGRYLLKMRPIDT